MPSLHRAQHAGNYLTFKGLGKAKCLKKNGVLFESNCVRSLLGAVIYTNGSDTRLNSERVAIELGQLVFFAKPLSNN